MMADCLGISQETHQRPSGGTGIAPYHTFIVEALESFQSFDPASRRFAISLYAAELGINQLHFYAIALHAGLEGAS